MDWNNDGKKDLVSGDGHGQVWIFLNIGTADKPGLAKGELIKAGGKIITGSNPKSYVLAGSYTRIHIADWDGDGLKDLLVGHEGDSVFYRDISLLRDRGIFVDPDNRIIFYKNIGTASSPSFKAPIEIRPMENNFTSKPVKENFPARPSPCVVDWDGDGINDLLVGSMINGIIFYRNVGTNKSPQLASGKRLNLEGTDFTKGRELLITVTDWNNDGKSDIIAGNLISNSEGSKTRNIANLWLFLGE